MDHEENTTNGTETTEEQATTENPTNEGAGETTTQTPDDTGADDTKDSHGQPGINKERHDREMAEKDAKIAELEAKVAEAAKSEESRVELQKEIDALKAQSADDRVTHALELSGCVDVKAAKARLDDFGGEVEKLKESCPYLFTQTKQTGSTGAKPAGAATGGLDDKLDRAFGLKK